MKTEEIAELFGLFEAAATEIEGVECWSARDLQVLLGYSKWENFEKVIEKAKEACKNAGEIIEDHFPDVRKMVEIGSGTERAVSDIALTRYACYLIAQNGDSRKAAAHEQELDRRLARYENGETTFTTWEAIKSELHGGIMP